MWLKAEISLWVVLLLIHRNHGLFVNQRIINGSQLESGSEYAVEVISSFELSSQTWGGGTLIAQNVVLTQAQLVNGFTSFIVRFGSVNWGEMVTMEVTDTAKHPLYDPDTHVNDIALLRLSGSIEQSTNQETRIES